MGEAEQVCGDWEPADSQTGKPEEGELREHRKETSEFKISEWGELDVTNVYRWSYVHRRCQYLSRLTVAEFGISGQAIAAAITTFLSVRHALQAKEHSSVQTRRRLHCCTVALYTGMCAKPRLCTWKVLNDAACSVPARPLSPDKQEKAVGNWNKDKVLPGCRKLGTLNSTANSIIDWKYKATSCSL